MSSCVPWIDGDMEAKLAEYRAKKAKEKNDTDINYRILQRAFYKSSEINEKSEEHRTENTTPASFKEPNSTKKEMETLPSEEECKTTNTPFSWLLLFLKILLWMSLWRIFIELQFGAVFFAVSALIFIYFNTRTGKSKSNTLSAYSVFNPNCERLQGTITAEQFERELLHRPTQDTVS
ncbi:SAYSvFN domain-containing protein 1-like [Pomacea canaliculata]|uniref:SAYSvFN domain-containing protein 1-like n=1 Tax=Pomacea canaliculata TaxID=400727 RepID=UPI000D739FA7|nr:SAYSvFN domain-containing protein 1-like [Pomacea canaliculata]